MTKLDQVFDRTISQHGYWLINNREYIEEDIVNAVNKFGYIMTFELLNKIDSPFVINLYKKIEECRNNAYTNA